MTKILICDQVEVDSLALGDSIDVDYRPSITREELLETVGPYDALIVRSRTKVDRDLIDRASSLKLVARPGTGLDNVDVEYAKSKGIQVVNSPESLVEAVSEHVVLLMLALSRKLVEADQSIKAGRWEKNSLMGTELKGKTLGIVGLGRIGRRIAEIAGTLGMHVLIYDVIAIPDEVISKLHARVVLLDELFASSDYVTLHVPLTAESRHMVDSERLSGMKKSAFLINTSRGGVVDEDSLAAALAAGQMGGAALDVFEHEPPSGAILKAPNTILTPHIGGQTEEAQADAIAVIGAKVRTFFEKS
ncbi:MAG: hydroxyacid dehydrogenase [Thaumarchaeota archaeon]|nr:hydroxyacid dehydrogenase [Nitrososphaerota archaeon]